MKKLIYLLVSCMLFSLAACNDDKEDNGGSIIGLWKMTKYEGQAFVDEDISSDPDEEAYCYFIDSYLLYILSLCSSSVLLWRRSRVG